MRAQSGWRTCERPEERRSSWWWRSEVLAARDNECTLREVNPWEPQEENCAAYIPPLNSFCSSFSLSDSHTHWPAKTLPTWSVFSLTFFFLSLCSLTPFPHPLFSLLSCLNLTPLPPSIWSPWARLAPATYTYCNKIQPWDQAHFVLSVSQCFCESLNDKSNWEEQGLRKKTMVYDFDQAPLGQATPMCAFSQKNGHM